MFSSLDINECSSQPCLNGGRCVDAVNGYTCDCVQGWDGVHCDIGKLRLSSCRFVLLVNPTFVGKVIRTYPYLLCGRSDIRCIVVSGQESQKFKKMDNPACQLWSLILIPLK